CVPAGDGVADLIRDKHAATITLGIAGDGPLIELAGIEEYLAELKPRVVLWLYYHNDLASLEAEKQSPLLRRYLEPGFRQDLAAKQERIDRALAERAGAAEVGAPVWPAWMLSTRARTPVVLQDLVMGEQHSSASAIVRLDRLSGFVAARLAPKH